MKSENRICIIDIGSNTVKMSVFEPSDGALLRLIFSKSRVLSLVLRREEGRLTDEGLALLIATISDYKVLAEKNGASRTRACATASLRGISNADDVLKRIFAETEISVDLLSPEREAEISFAGLASLLPDGESGLMADMGGGSCELALFDSRKIRRKTSLPFGCASLYGRFVSGDFPTDEEAAAISDFVLEKLGNESLFAGEKNMYLVGGTAKSGAALSRFINKKTDDCPIYRFDGFESLCDFLLTPSPLRSLLVEKVVPDRKTTITPGMCAFRTLFSALGCNSVFVASSGLREGYLSLILSGEIS